MKGLKEMCTQERQQRRYITNWVNEKMELGYCTQTEWDEFVEVYKELHNTTPKLYGDDIKIVEDINLDDSTTISSYHANNGDTAKVIKGQRGYTLIVFNDSNVIKFTNNYDTLRGAKISVSRMFKDLVED